MRVVSILKDERIGATSVLLDMSVKDYLRLVSGAEGNLDIQRAVVKGFKPYERLRGDLAKGGLIPAPTLAAKANTLPVPTSIGDDGFIAALTALSPRNVYIIDGLQRTNAIQQVYRSLEGADREQFSARIMRVEFWPDITLPALTYRMILLNAGQKPMSLRHQMEVVSGALCDALLERLSPRLNVYREKDDSRRSGPGQYQFSLLATASQAFVQKTPHVELRNEVIEELTKIDALETYGRTVGSTAQTGEKDPTEAFIDYVDFLIEFDKRLWNIYPETRQDDNGDTIPSARNLLTRDTFHLGLAAAYAWCLGNKPDALTVAKQRLFQSLGSARPEVDDPLALARFEKIQVGFRRKDNVGEQTRNLIYNGFKEYFRSEGLTLFEQCWLQA
jgi:hypothetical protein